MDANGDLADGRYLLAEPLGIGGMATVFRATDRELGRQVAVKVLHPHLASDPRFVERFAREARAAAALAHPNAVSIFDSSSGDGRPYIVMEYVPGKSVAEILSEEGPFDPSKAAQVGAAVCRALGAAHEQGLIHRDIKPGNIILTDDNAVKVCDFGIARALTAERMTRTGTVLGTAAYMSPEQSTGEGIDARSDLYSLGCVLYEMLTGRPPFTSPTSEVAMIYKHATQAPKPPSRVNRSVGPSLDAVVLKGLEKRPERRFQTASEMESALELAADGDVTAPVPLALVRGTTVSPLPEAATLEIDQSPAASDTALLETMPEARRSRAVPRWIGQLRKPRVAWLVAAVLSLVVVALYLLTQDLSQEPRGSGAVVTSPTPEATSPTPSTPAVALATLQQTIRDGIERQEIRRKFGEDLLKMAAEVFEKDEGEDVGKELAELRAKVEELAKERKIEAGRAAAILAAIDGLESSLGM